jgi:hypothetical protein
MSLFRVAALPALVVLTARSSEASRPEPLSTLRVADCEGPATSLDPALAATLPPRDGLMTPDDFFADLARRTPGGFAGVHAWDGIPTLLLTDVSPAAAAKKALAPYCTTFDIAGAQVREARWNFAQLYDWHSYLMQQYTRWADGVTSTDKDELINRLSYGVRDNTALLEVAQKLSAMNLPCDLISLRIVQPVTMD